MNDLSSCAKRVTHYRQVLASRRVKRLKTNHDFVIHSHDFVTNSWSNQNVIRSWIKRYLSDEVCNRGLVSFNLSIVRYAVHIETRKVATMVDTRPVIPLTNAQLLLVATRSLVGWGVILTGALLPMTLLSVNPIISIFSVSHTVSDSHGLSLIHISEPTRP